MAILAGALVLAGQTGELAFGDDSDALMAVWVTLSSLGFAALIVAIWPNVEPGDLVVLPDGREALVTARVEMKPGPLAALLEAVIASARLPLWIRREHL